MNVHHDHRGIALSDPRESFLSVAGFAYNCDTWISREDRPQRMPDKLNVVHQQDPDDLFTSHYRPLIVVHCVARFFRLPPKRADQNWL